MSRIGLFVILLLPAMGQQTWGQVGIPHPILTQFNESEELQERSEGFHTKAFRYRAFNVQAPSTAVKDIHNAAYELHELVKSGRKIQFSTLSNVTSQLTQQLKVIDETSIPGRWLKIDVKRGKQGTIFREESEKHQQTRQQLVPRPFFNGQAPIWCESLGDFRLQVAIDPKVVVAVKEQQDQAGNPTWVLYRNAGMEVSFSSPNGCFQHYLAIINGRPISDRLELGQKRMEAGFFYPEVVAETRFNQQGITQVSLYVIEDLQLGDFFEAANVPAELEAKTKLPKIRSPE